LVGNCKVFNVRFITTSTNAVHWLFQGALTVLAVLRYRKGVSEDFGASDLNNAPTIDQSSNPYASFGGEPDQSYQQAPFSGNTGPPQTTSSEYQPPTY